MSDQYKKPFYLLLPIQVFQKLKEESEKQGVSVTKLIVLSLQEKYGLKG